jgi:tRNA(adenine34) deaminase
MDDPDALAFMLIAMEEAAQAVADGDPPFGAVLVDETGTIVARAHNTQVSTSDPTAHAEINALRAGGAARGTPDLDGWCLIVNAEPCSMCSSAIVKAHIAELVFGAPHEPHLDPYLPAAAVLSRAQRPPLITEGLLADECAAQIAEARAAAPGDPVD